MQNYQSVFLPKTDLDYMVEDVERKYGSISKAPSSALVNIHEYVNNNGMSKHSHHYSRTPKRVLRQRKHDRYMLVKHTKVYHLNNRWYTDNHSLSYMSMMIHQHRNKRIASQLSGVSVYLFHKLTPSKKTIVYHYKGINFKFNSYHKLVDMCSHMLDWYFAPQTMEQLRNHDYKGKISTYHKYAVLYYRRK